MAPVRTGVRVDGPVFCAGLGCVAAAAVPMVFFPDEAEEFVEGLYNWIAGTLGLFYLWACVAATVFLLWLACGRHGRRVLGAAAPVPEASAQAASSEASAPEASVPDGPEYGTVSWMAMLFCAGIGAGLLYWSTAEWAFYIDQPPFGIARETVEAQEWAATYGIFHWGVSAWCLYCLPTVAIAWPYYRYRLPYLRLSCALVGILGRDFPERPGGRAVDLLFIVALIGGTGTSLGLATPMLGAVAAELFQIDESLELTLTICGLCVALFATSVYLGLGRGIRQLSNVNLGLAGMFLLWVLMTGPALFALELGTSSLGLMSQEFVRMNMWTDALRDTGFTEAWTIFYWAWWIAYGPYMGLFVTKISRGRTLRAVIFGMLGFGSLGCAVFYIVWGNSVMWMDLHQGIGFLKLVRDEQTATAIAQAVAAVAGYPLPLLAFLILGLVFVATTYDSASYCVAAAATRGLAPGVDPAPWHRVFWALVLAVLPVALVVVGTQEAAKATTLVVSLPLLGLMAAMAWSLVRSLNDR